MTHPFLKIQTNFTKPLLLLDPLLQLGMGEYYFQNQISEMFTLKICLPVQCKIRKDTGLYLRGVFRTLSNTYDSAFSGE